MSMRPIRTGTNKSNVSAYSSRFKKEKRDEEPKNERNKKIELSSDQDKRNMIQS